VKAASGYKPDEVSGSARWTGRRSLVYRQDGVYAENAGAIFCQIQPPLLR